MSAVPFDNVCVQGDQGWTATQVAGPVNVQTQPYGGSVDAQGVASDPGWCQTHYGASVLVTPGPAQPPRPLPAVGAAGDIPLFWIIVLAGIAAAITAVLEKD